MEDETKKVLKYKELLLKSQEEKSQEEIQYAVEQAKLKLDASILETKKSLSSAKKQLQESIESMGCRFDPERIINAKMEVKGWTDGLYQLEELKKELF